MSPSQLNNSILLDVVIPVYGRGDLLAECIDALDKQTIPYNLIIVDNAAPPDLLLDALYKKLHSKSGCKIIYNKKNLGFPKACNIGARQGKAPYILFLNSDAILQPDALELMVKEIQIPETGVVGLRLLFPPNPKDLDPRIRPVNKIQHNGVSINIRGQVNHPCVGWDTTNKTIGKVKGKPIWAVTGAVLLTKRVLFRNAGGFDERYGLGTYEDIDYCLTVRSMKHDIRIVIDTFAYHYTGGTSELYRIAYPLNENKQKFMEKWQGRPELFWSDWMYL